MTVVRGKSPRQPPIFYGYLCADNLHLWQLAKEGQHPIGDAGTNNQHAFAPLAGRFNGLYALWPQYVCVVFSERLAVCIERFERHPFEEVGE